VRRSWRRARVRSHRSQAPATRVVLGTRASLSALAMAVSSRSMAGLTLSISRWGHYAHDPPLAKSPPFGRAQYELQSGMAVTGPISASQNWLCSA
jgi:hypothetical protein